MSVEDTAAPSAADTTTAPAATPEKTSDVKPDTAASSAPAGAKAETSVFDDVKAALNKDKPAEVTPPSEAKQADSEVSEPEAEEDQAAPDDGKLSDDERKTLSQKTQQRIQKLAKSNGELREPAERWTRLDSFLRRNTISNDEAANALDIVALIKRDPKAALTKIRELGYQISLQLGETLPKDIQERVTSGTIDEATGRELAIARAQASGFKQSAEQSAQEIAQSNADMLRKNVVDAVNAWETYTAGRDPDFARKKSLIKSEFRALLQGGAKITSPEDGTMLMKQAYTKVNNDLKAFVPAKQPVTPQSANTTAAATSVPKTHEDAVFAAFGRTRQAA